MNILLIYRYGWIAKKDTFLHKIKTLKLKWVTWGHLSLNMSQKVKDVWNYPSWHFYRYDDAYVYGLGIIS